MNPTAKLPCCGTCRYWSTQPDYPRQIGNCALAWAYRSVLPSWHDVQQQLVAPYSLVAGYVNAAAWCEHGYEPKTS